MTDENTTAIPTPRQVEYANWVLRKAQGWWSTLTKLQRSAVTCLFKTSLISLLVIAAPWLPRTPKLDDLFQAELWVSYDPPTFVPSKKNYPSTDEILQNLEAIQRAGFEGVVTYSSLGSFSRIPELAGTYDLDVIVGVYDPTNDAELYSALKSKNLSNVRGFCLGHNYVHERPELMGRMKTILNAFQQKTNKPVTFSMPYRYYVWRPEICDLGDWVFPDFGLVSTSDIIFSQETTLTNRPPTVQYSRIDRDEQSTSPQERASRIFDATMRIARSASEIDRRLMIKNIAFPFRREGESSLDAQELFFDLVNGELLRLRNQSISVRVVVHSAFDLEWKREAYGAWDASTGLISTSGLRRPAVKRILEMRELID